MSESDYRLFTALMMSSGICFPIETKGVTFTTETQGDGSLLVTARMRYRHLRTEDGGLIAHVPADTRAPQNGGGE